MTKKLLEDVVRDRCAKYLGFNVTEDGIQQGTGQITTFNQLGIKPFVGLGLGVAWSDINADGSRKGTHFAVMPRVGVELSHHLRITLAYKIFERANNHLTLSLGYVFGGGRR